MIRREFRAKVKPDAAARANGKCECCGNDIRGTTVTLLFEAGCTVAECAAITGHTLRSAQTILDKYLSRTRALATAAIVKFENRMNTERANRTANRHSGG